MTWFRFNLKAFIKQYGLAGFVTYELISLGTLGTAFGAIRLGVNVEPVTEWIQDKKTKIYDHFNIQHSLEESVENEWGVLGTQFLLALAIDKLLFPIRMAGTIYWTPKMSQLFIKRGWIKNKS